MTEYQQVKVADLSVHPENARVGNVSTIVESIQANGFYGALIVQTGTNRILVGNHRYLAAVELGMETVPVLWADVDDDRARKIMLADNRTSDIATYDDHLLLDLLRAGDLDGTGYLDTDVDDLARLLEPPNLDDLIDQVGGDHDDDSVFTSNISIKVTPDTYRAWGEMWSALGFDSDDDRALHLIQLATDPD
jgi:hypothetical protein